MIWPLCLGRSASSIVPGPQCELDCAWAAVRAQEPLALELTGIRPIKKKDKKFLCEQAPNEFLSSFLALLIAFVYIIPHFLLLRKYKFLSGVNFICIFDIVDFTEFIHHGCGPVYFFADKLQLVSRLHYVIPLVQIGLG